VINYLVKYMEKVLSLPKDFLDVLDDEENAIIDE
jgi:hypothetical protein